MIIYKDIITGDEIISDSYEMKLVDDIVYEVEGKSITKGSDKIDIGANPSAEEQEESLEDNAVTVIDIVDSFRFSSTQYDKKAYLTHLKGYMKKVKEELKKKEATEDYIRGFESKAQAFAKKVVGNFKLYDFYIGESMDPDGMVILLNYREDGVTPFFTIWKDGLHGMKV